mmetsp:Transcript_67662/g.188803  ORF Transcript_67662/g.188803 Transcript_67662/m.188803 type:complete len:298 (-) Transcript_67662:38-931(-)
MPSALLVGFSTVSLRLLQRRLRRQQGVLGDGGRVPRHVGNRPQAKRLRRGLLGVLRNLRDLGLEVRQVSRHDVGHVVLHDLVEGSPRIRAHLERRGHRRQDRVLGAGLPEDAEHGVDRLQPGLLVLPAPLAEHAERSLVYEGDALAPRLQRGLMLIHLHLQRLHLGVTAFRALDLRSRRCVRGAPFLNDGGRGGYASTRLAATLLERRHLCLLFCELCGDGGLLALGRLGRLPQPVERQCNDLCLVGVALRRAGPDSMRQARNEHLADAAGEVLHRGEHQLQVGRLLCRHRSPGAKK